MAYQGCKMTIFLHRAKPFKQILPQHNTNTTNTNTNTKHLPAFKDLLGTALPAGAPVTLVLPLQPLAGRGGAGALQELLLDGRHCRLYH